MHRDTQIGLAMAIVLIGFAAALCFPREGQVRGPAAELPDAAALDAAIAASSVKLYAEPSPAASPPPTSPPAAEPETTSVAAAPAFQMDQAATPAAADPDPTLAATPVEPPAQTPAAALITAPPPSPPAAAPAAVHVVQSGDTLSGLAQKYLGSVARYPELFEANRDVLDSPDDLRLGMRLRIPER